MRKVVVSQFVSLDGVFEDPGGAEGFKHGGWCLRIDRGEDGDRFKFDELMAADALLLGRVTYEGFAEAWPNRTDEAGFADKFNSMPKYVASSTLVDPEWSNSHVLGADLAAEVARLKEEGEGDLLVNGSAQLVRGLAELDLVDEYRLMVFPVVLGTGRRLFEELAEPRPLRLTGARTVGEGVQIVTLERGA